MNKKLIFLYVLMAMVMLSSILVVSYVKKSGQCDLNPFVYLTERAYDQGLEIFCSCTPLDPRYEMFYFDRFGVSVREDNSYFGSGSFGIPKP